MQTSVTDILINIGDNKNINLNRNDDHLQEIEILLAVNHLEFYNWTYLKKEIEGTYLTELNLMN